MKHRDLKLLTLLSLAFLFLSTTGSAQSSSVGAQEVLEADETRATETQAMSFVKLHHPELAALLEILKTTDLSKYNAAIKDVTKAIKRLDGSRKRDEKLHLIEIEGWKIQSKIDLLLAKGMAKGHNVAENDFKELIENRLDNQIARTQRELELLEDRRTKLAESLEKLGSNRQAQVDKQLSNVLKRMKSDKPKGATQKP